ncbi:MAG: ArnT family glycosyltransferase [Candidatus Limnocylindria bacterium]
MLIAAGLGLILAAATLLRFLDLGINPGGLYTDEATEALSAQRILHDPGFRPIFLPEGGGREALFAYLVAGVFHVFGETPLALRATAAGIGVAGVLGVWLLARRFGVVPGLAAAAWAAGSLWLICISRDGMRNALVPLLGAVALAAVLAWHDRPGRLMAILAGAGVSLATLYTYQPLKLIPLLLVIWLVWLRRVNRPAYLRLRPGLSGFVIAFLVVGAPMLAAAALDPVSYFGRAAGVTFNPGSAVDLPAHWLRTLGMFAMTGDPNPRHDVAAAPLLGWPLLAVALAGGIRLWRHRHEPAEALILWSLPVLLLPPLVATEGGAPHFLRALGLAAPLAVMIGLGVGELVDQARARWGRRAAAAVAGGVAIGMLALAIAGGQAYLSRSVADRFAGYRYDLVAMAARAGPGDLVILDDYSASVVRFLDAGHLPTVVAPGTRLAEPEGTTHVLALSREEIATALGARAAERAVPVVTNPEGEPVVWSIAALPSDAL